MGHRWVANLLLVPYPRRKEVQLGKKLSYSGSGFLLGALLAALLMLMPRMVFAAVTIGNTNIGIVDSGDSNYLNGSKVTVGATTLQVTSMTVYVGNVDIAPNNQYQLAIYADANGSPSSLIASSTTGVLTPNAWNTLSLNATLQPNTTYWLMYNSNGRTDLVNNMYYSTGAQGAGSYSTNAVSFGSWPSTFPAVTKSTSVYSLYATAGSSVDPTPPTVAITAPQQGTTVSGIVNVSANATDNVGVTSVQFQLDGTNIGGAVTTTPYNVSWTSTQATNGSHTLTAVARDAAGNQTTSAPVAVTVSNNNSQSQIVGEWSPVLAWPLVAMHANLLKTGKVLVYDEENAITHPMLWDPATQAFTDTGTLGKEIWCSGHAQLADGKLFVAGGHLANGGEDGIKSTYVYNPDANTWSQSSDMAYPRWYPALTKLSDGRIAIFSGQITTGVFADTPEIYNPSNASLSTLTTITTPELHEEEYPANFYLPGGKVLAISPEFGGVQLFDSLATTWTRVNTTPIKLGSAVQYRPGKVLMSGGATTFNLPAGGQAAVLDMNVTPSTWRPTASMSFGRYMHNLVMLPTGKVLAIGGSSITYERDNVPGPLPVELWDPNTETWATLAAMAVPRMYHSTALLLPDGRVLAAGGGRVAGTTNQLSAQVYSPAYLFKGARPTITSAPDNVPYGSAPFTVNSPEASTIASVSLISLGSVTHSTDMNQSYAELPFTKTTNQLVVSAPQDATQISPGYYMLFLVDANGVPSVAKILKIGAAVPPPSSTTLGLTSKGSILDSEESNSLNGSKVQTSNGGSIVSMSVYIGNVDTATNSRQYQFAIYNDNAGRPGTLVAKTATSGTLTANAWNTLPLNATLQPNTTYWLMYNTNGRTASVNNMYFNNGSIGQGAFSTANVNFGTWPSTFPAATTTNAVFSLYATFGP
jgi:Domain of unknown function (DUF1929)/Bacterial Ig domain/Kelch motif